MIKNIIHAISFAIFTLVLASSAESVNAGPCSDCVTRGCTANFTSAKTKCNTSGKSIGDGFEKCVIAAGTTYGSCLQACTRKCRL